MTRQDIVGMSDKELMLYINRLPVKHQTMARLRSTMFSGGTRDIESDVHEPLLSIKDAIRLHYVFVHHQIEEVCNSTLN